MNQPCAECGRPANLSCVENGVQSYLCGPCAAQKSGIFGVSEFIRGFLRPRSSNNTCPFCGATAQDIERTGLVGCPICYEAMPGPIEEQTGLVKGNWTHAN